MKLKEVSQLLQDAHEEFDEVLNMRCFLLYCCNIVKQ